jgi:hypothetical protein
MCSSTEHEIGSGPAPFIPPERPGGRMNTTDPDARRMKQGPRSARPTQAVTTEQQIVIAAERADDGTDFAQLNPMIATAAR